MKLVGVSVDGPLVTQRPGRSTTWWGMVGLVVSETMLFSLLLVVYLYARAGAGGWPPEPLPLPELTVTGVRAVLLLATTVPMVLAERALTHRDRPGRAALHLLVVLVLSTVFMAGHVVEQFTLVEELDPTEQTYGAVFLTIVNFHALHLLVGMALNAVALLQVLNGRVRHGRTVTLEVAALYWHFVDAVWVVVYTLLYLSPHLLGRG